MRNCQTFLEWLAFYIPTSKIWSFQYLSCCVFLMTGSSGYRVVIHCGFDSLFLDDWWWCAYFLWTYCTFVFGEMSVQILCPTFNWVIRLLLLSFHSSLCILYTSSLQVNDLQKFCPILWVVFSFSCWYVLKHISFDFDNVKFICFFFLCCASNVIYRKPSPNPRSWRCKNML